LLTSDLDSPFAVRQDDTAGESGNSAEFSNGRKFLLGHVSRE
jgi:hypothetical protein